MLLAWTLARLSFARRAWPETPSMKALALEQNILFLALSSASMNQVATALLKARWTWRHGPG